MRGSSDRPPTSAVDIFIVAKYIESLWSRGGGAGFHKSSGHLPGVVWHGACLVGQLTEMFPDSSNTSPFAGCFRHLALSKLGHRTDRDDVTLALVLHLNV